MLQELGARLISPARESRAAEMAGAAGRFYAMACRIACKPASKPFAWKRQEMPRQFLRRPPQARSFAARTSASTGTKSSTAYHQSPRRDITGTWSPRNLNPLFHLPRHGGDKGGMQQARTKNLAAKDKKNVKVGFTRPQFIQ